MINNILGLLALAKKTVLLDNIKGCLIFIFLIKGIFYL